MLPPLGDAEAALGLDDTGVLHKGRHSAGRRAPGRPAGGSHRRGGVPNKATGPRDCAGYGRETPHHRDRQTPPSPVEKDTTAHRILTVELGEVTRAKYPERLPVVFSRAELRAVLAHVHGRHWPMASLLYGAGLCLMEGVRLRVKDVDFDYRQILIRDGKGQKDRVTVLPQSLAEPLKGQLDKEVKILHQQDLAGGFGEVYLPFALERKYASASREWGWQYVFAARRRSIDPRSGKDCGITSATGHCKMPSRGRARGKNH